jgi:hypothetical protein
MAIEILQIGLPKLDFILILLKLYIKDFYLFSFFAKQNVLIWWALGCPLAPQRQNLLERSIPSRA